MPVSRLLSFAALAASFTVAVQAQSIISAHSGVLHHSEGAVFIGDQAVNQKYGTFPEIKEKAIFRTEAGRAEVLLTPGVFLRLGENSSFRMIDNRLIDTRVELLSGEAVIEADDPMKVNNVTIVYKDFQVHVRKAGVFQIQAEPAQLKVYHGEAEVERNGEVAIIKSDRLMAFNGAMASQRFDSHDGDELSRWSKRRSEYVSAANVSAAKSLRDSGATWNSSGWYYNPYYSMFTYIPMRGVYYNPYGYSFWSPYSVYELYAPRQYYNPNNGNNSDASRPNYGYSSVAQTNTGYSGAIASSAPAQMSSPAVSGSAASAPISHGGGSAGGHGR